MNKEVENEKEILDRDEAAVSRLVAELKPVEAPANFERRVMSRIAEGEPQKPSVFAIPALIYIVPAIFVLLLGAFFVFRIRQQTTRPENASQAPNGVQAPYVQSPSQVAGSEPSQTTDTLARSQPEKPGQQAVFDRRNRLPRPSGANSNDNNGGGSITFGQDQARQQFPEGINPRSARTNINPDLVGNKTDLPLQEILVMLGISAEYRNEWLVKSVSDHSTAVRSGVKAGDVLTGINDKQLTSEPVYRGPGNFSTVTVRREGKSLTLKLK